MSIFHEVPELSLDSELYPFGEEHSTTIEMLQKDFKDIKPYSVAYFRRNEWIYLWVLGNAIELHCFYKMPINYWRQQSHRILNWKSSESKQSWQKDGF